MFASPSLLSWDFRPPADAGVRGTGEAVGSAVRPDGPSMDPGAARGSLLLLSGNESLRGPDKPEAPEERERLLDLVVRASLQGSSPAGTSLVLQRVPRARCSGRLLARLAGRAWVLL
ncbi:MAG: hypothetical protein AMXMBFR58_12690 [Phycisphaerae bacterium]